MTTPPLDPSLKPVLMVAYHFPPLAGSSGIQRTLRFVQHLPRFGWQPIVLTVHPRAYPRRRSDLLGDIPSGTVVHRAFALDTARHLSLGKQYIGSMARPDRWISWRFAGVHSGMRMIRQLRPRALWSTYPIATAHVIGAELQRRSGLPWIADFRDPMAQDDYPPDPRTRAQFLAIEERAFRQASLATFTTPSAARDYGTRYPAQAERMVVLENGYDEESFRPTDDSSPRIPIKAGTITLLHSGMVYTSERDPTHFFGALRQLKEAGAIVPGQLQVRFRASANVPLLRQLASDHGVEAFIETPGAIAYREALDEMQQADGLLVMQGANCNAQIPAKVYEYLRAGRPILCLSDPAGDTAAALREAGVLACARLDNAAEIASLLQAFIADVGSSHERRYLPEPSAVAGASRLTRARSLAAHLDRLAPS